MQRHVFYKAKHGFYLCAGNTVIGSFGTGHAALRQLRNFAAGVHVQIKKTSDAGECITGQRGSSQKSRGIYRRQLKPGDFTL
jgi:hypothetical protein